MKKTAVITQARMGSTRLPGKVLMKVSGRPLLQHFVERVRKATSVDQVIIATTVETKDDAIAQFAERLKFDFYRGSEEDVLDRYYQTAKSFDVGTIIRITSDCPLVDPQVIDRVVNVFREGGWDYVSNLLTPTYPDGLDVEVFSFQTLETAWTNAKHKSEREHVTPYIWKQPDRFRMVNAPYSTDLSKLRWTIDTPEDFEFIKKIYEGLYQPDKIFHLPEILAFLKDNPDLFKLNAGHERDESYWRLVSQEKGGK